MKVHYVDAFIAYSGRPTVMFTRNTDKDKFRYPTETSVRRLSVVIDRMRMDDFAEVRPFRSGLGWHADITSIPRSES